MGKIDGLKALRLQEIGCLACLKEGRPGVPSDLHHPTTGGGGYRMGDSIILALCPWHHEGRASGKIEDNRKLFGPSLKKHKRDFIARYGTEQELLEETERLLREYEEKAQGR